MSPLLIAISLLAAQPAEAAAPAPVAAAEAAYPPGAPREDYQFVSWCYGALRGYLELHDEVMPEVTRIETTYRAPGRKLADDLKVYADMQRDGRRQLTLFQDAMVAAEKASPRPINAQGAEAVRKGRSVWGAGPEVTKARKAQEWMSWALPARCEATATDLKARAPLMGATFQVNAEPAPEAAAASPETPPAEAPVKAAGPAD